MKIHEFLADGSRWTTGTIGCTAEGKSIHDIVAVDHPAHASQSGGFGPAFCRAVVSHPEACRFCLLGAVYVCYTDEEAALVIARLDAEVRDSTRWIGLSVMSFSDLNGLAAVLKLCRELDV